MDMCRADDPTRKLYTAIGVYVPVTETETVHANLLMELAEHTCMGN